MGIALSVTATVAPERRWLAEGYRSRWPGIRGLARRPVARKASHHG
jgi:hypothetical protein